MKKNFRIFSVILTVCMLIGLFPISALAVDEPHEHVYTEKVIRPQSCEATGVKKLTCECGDYKYVAIPAHTYDEGVVTTPATCVKDGEKTATCTVCGETVVEKIPATGEHSYNDGVVTTPAKCGVAGLKTFTCSVCNGTKTEEIPALEHEYEERIVDADCLNPMRVGMACKHCGDPKPGETLEPVEGMDALGHDYVLDTTLENYKAATCTEDGLNTYKCSRCGDTAKTEVTTATDHVWGEEELVDADCENAQHTVKECTKCDAVEKKDTGLEAALGHDWDAGVVTTPAKCEVPGVLTKTCSRCEKTSEEEITALVHDYETIEVEPTCQAAGYTYTKCTVCGNETESVEGEPANPDAHTAKVEKVLREATCTEAGVEKIICENCGTAMGYRAIDPAHNWDEGEVTTAADCGNAGVLTKTCSKCEETTTEEIPATGEHSYDDGEITTAATCTDDGVKTFTCSVCNGTKTEKIDATGHSEGEGVVTTPAKCGVAGVKTFTCSVCNNERTEEIPALAHEYEERIVDADCLNPMRVGMACKHCGQAQPGETLEPVEGMEALGHDYVLDTTLENYKAATCTDDGLNTYKCSRCGDTAKTEVTTATGHEWGEEELVDADCENAQHTLKECTKCDAEEKTETGLVEALGHDWDAGEVTTAATCTEAGVLTKTCSRCEKTSEEEITVLGHDYETITEEATCQAAERTYDKCKRCGDITNEATNGDPDTTAHVEKVVKVLREATCTEAGVAKIACELCNAELGYRAIDPAHSWDEGEVTTAADCGNAGVLTKTCSKCEETKTEAIPATGEHNFVDKIVDATCTTPMMAGQVCTVCDQVDGEMTVLGDALGHDIQTIVVPPTCTEEGYTYTKCSRCDYETEHTDIVEPGDDTHAWEYGDDAVEATCTEAGFTGSKTCTKCGATAEGEEINALGHDIEVKDAKEATCTEAGFTGDKVCKRCNETVETGTVIEMAPHTEETIPAIAAACGKPGSTEGKICTVCETITVEPQVVPALEHQYTVTGPFYNEDHSVCWFTYTCDLCGHSYNSEETAS